MALDFLKPWSPEFNPKRIAVGAVTGGASELLPGGGQDQDQNVEDATNAWGNVYDSYGRLQQKQQQRLTDQKAGAKGNYAGAQGVASQWKRPTQSQDWYNTATARYSGPSYAEQDYLSNGGSQPQQLGDYYSNYKPNTVLQDYTKNRTVNPATQTRQQLETIRGEGPGYSANDLQGARQFAYGPTGTDARMTERRSLGPDALDARLRTRGETGATELTGRLGERQQFANRETQSHRILGETTDPNAFSTRSDALGRELESSPSGQYTGDVYDRARHGQDDTGRFLSGYDPEATAGLGETYQRLRDQGPQYEEDFYNSQLTGDNPAYNLLQDDLRRDTARSSAARGGFVAGKTMDMERRAASRLAADEFSRRGELAAAAGGAHRAALGQQLSGAQALDQQRLGQASLYEKGAEARDTNITDLAKTRDTLAMQKIQNRIDLAKFGDSQGLDLEKLRAEVAHNEDLTQEQKQQALDNITKQISDFNAHNQDQMDVLGKGMSDRDITRQAALDELAKSGDTTRTSRRADYTQQLRNSDVYHVDQGKRADDTASAYDQDQTHQRELMDQLYGKTSDERGTSDRLKFDAAKGASGERQDFLNYRQQGARDTDTSEINKGTLLGNAADRASGEAAQGQKDELSAQMQLGDAQSTIDRAYDLAANGQMDDATMAQIDAKLQQAGVPAAAREQFRKNMIQYGQTAIEGYRTFSGGGVPGGGGGGGGGSPYEGGGPATPYQGYSVYRNSGTPEF